MNYNNTINTIIDEDQIFNTLAINANASHACIREILVKARELKGLGLDDTAALLHVNDPGLQEEIYSTAHYAKNEIYGQRVVIFAPLYVSNFCKNNCLYCAFRSDNKSLRRRALRQEEIIAETEFLVKQGHKRLLLVAGESYPNDDFNYITKAVENIYSVKIGNNGVDAIRRINVNIAPLTVEKFKELKAYNIGTYQLFQETYHRQIYSKVHLGGKKADYDWRLKAMDRALTAGIDDVGIGVLFGLADWRFEILALLQHAVHLQKEFGVGPHTISVPRLEPAFGSELASNPINPVSDSDFCKIIAVLRLAVPYTGIIMSTRETPEIRRMTLSLGISQISAGSRTNPGGYTENVTSKEENDAGQFSLGDHRMLDEVVNDIAQLGYIPSFCTACYRSGRTGEDFMCLAKPGIIKNMCNPNALLTFKEYLIDHAPDATRTIGEKLIQQELATMSVMKRNKIAKLLDNLDDGKRDLFV